MNHNVMMDTIVSLKYNSTYKKCKAKGIVFDITFYDYKRIHERKTCYYTGVPMELDGKHSPTIDRIDPDLGYVKDNLVLCSKYVNFIKGNLTKKEIKAMSLMTQETIDALNKVTITDLKIGELSMEHINIFKKIVEKIC